MLYTTKKDIDKLNTLKADTLFNMDMTYEIIFILIVGILMYGACAAGKQTLSWIILMLPVALLGSKIMLLFSEIPTLLKELEEIPYNAYQRIRGEPQLQVHQDFDDIQEDTYESRLREKQKLSSVGDAAMGGSGMGGSGMGGSAMGGSGMRAPLQMNRSKASSITSLGFGSGSGSPNESFAKF